MKHYSNNEKHWIYFKKGNLSDLYLLTTNNYSKTYIDCNTDKEMMTSIEDSNPNGKIIFDIGAFIGASSLVFSKLIGEQGKVIAFEPNPYNLRRIEKNLNKNTKYGKNIKVYPFALSDSNKKIEMLLSKDIDNGHSATSRIVGSHSTIKDENLPDGFEYVEIQTKTLDKFVTEENILPDILKVDIEGAEYEFLLGAAKTIKKIHPIIYMELHSQYCATKCTEFLILEGYVIKVLHEEEDNRIMILAEYNNNSNSGADIEKLKIFNYEFLILKNMSDSLAHLNKDLQIKNQQIINLIEENKILKTQKEQTEEEGKMVNKALSDKLYAIESSKSWKITKPLRKTMHIIETSKK